MQSMAFGQFKITRVYVYVSARWRPQFLSDLRQIWNMGLTD